MDARTEAGAPPDQNGFGNIGRDGFRIAAPAAAAALVAVAGVVGLSLTLTQPQPDAPIARSPVASSPAREMVPSPMSPGGLPGIAQNQVPGAGGVELGMEIVVKFKDDAKVKELCDLYWRDADAAKTRFETLKSAWPAFESLKLDRVTYSNELVVIPTASAPLQAIRQTARVIQSMPEISYAEPNPTALPGDRK